jgi:D-3-phosphoglycerate dehydrogenase
MATNKRKVLLPHTMGKQGIDLMRSRDDIETIIYPAGISQADFRPLIADVAGVALSGTAFKQAEMDAAPAMLVVAVAEQAFHFIIALAKLNHQMDRLVKDDKWTARHAMPPMEISGKTVIIVGFGRIGTRSARRCLAFDMNVCIYDPFVDQAAIVAAGCTPVADLDAALPGADFVSIHCPKSPATVDLFNAARLALMKKGAYLINTARGGIVNEADLYAALTSGHIAGAGLDVFDLEPTPTNNPLLKLPNVIASPHMAGVTVESIQSMAVATARNILSVLDGKPNAENAINPEVFA